jgi:hypothetical protein
MDRPWDVIVTKDLSYTFAGFDVCCSWFHALGCVIRFGCSFRVDFDTCLGGAEVLLDMEYLKNFQFGCC